MATTVAGHGRTGMKVAALASAAVLAVSGLAHGQDKLVVFSQPIPHYDAVWMADAKGLYKSEGLNVEFRQFSSGTVALQTFKAGEGDIIFGGDFPQVQYWLNNNRDFRVIAAVEKDGKGYLVTTHKSITKPQDLKGKVIATRVGSTMDWFLSEFLAKNGMSKKDVTVKNLDGPVMPTALCKGDIDAFVFWQPYNDKALELCPERAHNISDAEGYIPVYVLMGARPGWLKNPDNARKATAFLRATIKGKEIAERDLAAVQAYGKEKFSIPADAVKTQWSNNGRMMVLNDEVFGDYCKLAAWMRQESLLPGKLQLDDLMWTDGLKAIDPRRVTAVPGAC